MSYMILKGKIIQNQKYCHHITSFNVDYNNPYPNICICMNVGPFLVNNDTLMILNWLGLFSAFPLFSSFFNECSNFPINLHVVKKHLKTTIHFFFTFADVMQTILYVWKLHLNIFQKLDFTWFNFSWRFVPKG